MTRILVNDYSHSLLSCFLVLQFNHLLIMSKKSLIKKVQIIEKDDMAYSVVYEVHASHGGGSPVPVHTYFSLEDAMDERDLLYSLNIYDTVFIIENKVCFYL